MSWLVFLFLASLLSTKSGYSYILALLAVFSLWQMARAPHVSLVPSETGILLWMALFAGTGIVSTLYHGGPLSAYEVPAKFALGIVLVLCCIARPPAAMALWAGLVVSTTSGLAVAYWKMVVSGEFKAYGYTGAIQFGNLSLTMGVISIVGLGWAMRYCYISRRWWIVLLSMGATAGLLGSYFSGTRGGWVAIPLFVMLFLVSNLRRSNLFSCLLASIVIVVSGVVVGLYSPIVQERISQVSLDLAEYQEEGRESASSLGARLAIWQSTLEMLKDQPVMGLGQEGFRQELYKREQAGKIGAVPAALANTHNTFLEIWVIYGGLSALALMGLLASCVWHFSKYLRSDDVLIRCYALSGMCLVLGYVVYGQTQIMFVRNNTLMFFLLMLSVILGLLKRRRDDL